MKNGSSGQLSPLLWRLSTPMHHAWMHGPKLVNLLMDRDGRDSMQEKKRGLPWMGLMPCPMPDALKNPVATVLWHPKSWLCQNLPEINSARAHLPVLYFAPKNLQQNIACPVEERRKRRREPRPSVQGQGVVALFRRIWRRSSRRCWTCKDRNLWKLS